MGEENVILIQYQFLKSNYSKGIFLGAIGAKGFREGLPP
jgi:hypothetical protein